jgi:ribosomal protein S18 acetylase RimI-like enzyme
MDKPTSFGIRPARGADAQAIAACVDAAYRHYVVRIGKAPGPMLEDYAQVVARCQVSVAERDGVIVGVLVLAVTPEGFLLDNVAVHPSSQGKGVGRALLQCAESEARRQGYTSIYLYTHQQMTENQALYAKIGYVEYARRSEKGYDRVYMRKQLG